MLIFVLPAIYPNQYQNQLGIYIKEHCKALKDKYGHTFVILNGSSMGYKKWSLCGKIQKYNDEVGTVYECFTKGLMQSRLPQLAVRSYQKCIMNLFDLAVKEIGKPDLIYAHFSFPCGYVATKISRNQGIPFVVDEHYSLYLQEKIHPYIKKITKETINNAARFICVSERLKNALISLKGIRKNIVVIPNLVNDRYQFSSRKKKDCFVFFSAGNLVKSKNFDLLINSFVRAFDCDARVKLIIAGEGPERLHLQTVITAMKREKQIILLGSISSEKMLENYINCDCFALFSLYETFGIVYREALSVGRPILSLKNGGIEENWEAQYGMLINNSLDEAINSMHYMYSRIVDFDGEQISRLCRDRYSEKTVSQKVNSILLDAVKYFEC